MKMRRLVGAECSQIPDCCIVCRELYIKCNTLACNLDGVDTLPLYICEDFQRLKMYGKYLTYACAHDPEEVPDWTLQTR